MDKVYNSELKQHLHQWIVSLPGVSDAFWPNNKGGFYGFVYKNVEFAHFHQRDELDIKLGKQTIAKYGLVHPCDSVSHPKRSPRSAWIELPFNDSVSVQQVQDLVKLAISQL